MKRRLDEELLMKVLLDEASEEEKCEVQYWLTESSENRKKYEDLKLIWKSSRQLALSSVLDENEAWERFKQKVEVNKEEQNSKRKITLPSWLKVAASIVLASIGLWGGYSLVLDSLNRNTLVAVQTFNEVRIDTLSDGSIITLNKNSRVSYPKKFAKNNRTISLENGEVFFDIAPNASRPFIVHVNDVKVQVIGTSFNIKTQDDHTELIVESGIVEVSKKNVVIRLQRNDMVDIDKSMDSFDQRINTDQLYKYYRNKEFVVDNTPLWRLVEVLNEAYDAQIIIKGKSLERMTLNTTFKNKSLDAILTIICQTLKIEADKNGKQIILHN